MKFLADVNIPQSVIASLIHLHHDVLDIKKQSLASKDVELIKLAKKNIESYSQEIKILLP